MAGSSPRARGILATLIILARNSFEYNVIGFWVIIHISVYLASTFLVFLYRRKNTVFALLAIFGVVAPYFAIITAEILFLHRRPPFNLRYQKHRPAFKIISTVHITSIHAHVHGATFGLTGLCGAGATSIHAPHAWGDRQLPSAS